MKKKERNEYRLPELAARLREQREATGMSQVDVAAALGIGRKSYHNWEAGRRIPDSLMLLDISRVLDCGVEELLEGIGGPLRDE